MEYLDLTLFHKLDCRAGRFFESFSLITESEYFNSQTSENKNRFKSIVATDRYGVTYTKNFVIFADGHYSLQRFDSINTKTRHIKIERG